MIIGDTLSAVRQNIPRGPYVFNPPWTPMQLPAGKLASWWNADRTDLMVDIGGAIAQFADSVYGNVLPTAGAPQRPVWSANGYGGKAALFFDGVANTMVAPSTFNFPLGAAQGEIWAVVDQQIPDASATVGAILTYGPAQFSARSLRRTQVGGNGAYSFAVGNGAALPSSTRGTPPFFGRHFIRGMYDGADAQVSGDGALGAAQTILAATLAGNTVLGANLVGAQFWQGYIRHVIVIVGNLTALEVAQMNTWCATEAGLI